jgi:hypothetical protein
MKKIVLVLCIITNSIFVFSQTSTKSFCDSLKKMVPTKDEILDAQDDSRYWDIVNKIDPLVDSLYIGLQNHFKDNFFNIREEGVQYNHKTILNLIGSRLLDTTKKKTYQDLLPPNFKMPELSQSEIQVVYLTRILNQELEKMDSINVLQFYSNDYYVKYAEKFDSLNNLIMKTDTSTYIKYLGLFLDKYITMKSVVWSDSLYTHYDMRYKNEFLNAMLKTITNYHKLLRNSQYKQELDILVADIMYKYDRNDLVLEWLTRYIIDKSTSLNNFSWMKTNNDFRALELLDKVTRWDPETRVTLFYDLIADIPEPKDILFQNSYFKRKYYYYSDYYLFVPYLSNIPQHKKDLVSEKFRLSDALTNYSTYSQLITNEDAADQLLPLINVGASYPISTKENGDSVSVNFIKLLYLTKKSEYPNDIGTEEIYELLDEYLLQLLYRNEIKKAFDFFITFIKTRKILRTTPYFFNELLENQYLQDQIHTIENNAFRAFIFEYENLVKDTSISRSNIQVLLKKCDEILADYYAKKPATSEKEYLSFQDTSNYYYKLVYDFDLTINAMKLKNEKELILYDMGNEIISMTETLNSLNKKYDTAVITYDKQVAINQNLSVTNERLSDQYTVMKGNFNKMRKDTNALGIEKRALSKTVLDLSKDTAILNREKWQLNVEKDTLKNQNERKNKELKTKDDEINEKAVWVTGLSIAAVALILTSIFLPTYIYKRRTKHFNKKIKNLEEDFENKNYKLRLEKKDAELKLLGNLAYNHDVRKFIPIFPRMIKKTNESNKAQHQKVATAYAKYSKLNNDVVDELLNKVKNEIEIVSYSNEVILFLRKMDVTYTLKTNFDHDEELQNILIPKNMFTSFISNSLLHGSNGKNHINIVCTIQRIRNGYEFTIDDDGVGFEKLNIENKRNDRGIPLLLRQVSNFNEENKIWKLHFDLNSIQNKKQKNGVIVTFKMIKYE